MSRLWASLFLFVVLLIAAKLVTGLPQFCSLSTAKTSVIAAKKEINKTIPRGVWITVFSKYKILYSKPEISELIAYCKKNDINEVYLQIYRGGEAFYDSQLAGRRHYEEMIKADGTDPILFLLKEAHKNNVKIFAWVNTLSLAQNQDAPIVRKYGSAVFTRDQYLRGSIRTDGVNKSDKYYLRDDQIFLEPGDERVVDWTLAIVGEIISKYPDFDGLHLDYIRYPYPVPAIPDGRFLDYGIAYGYGERSLAGFKADSGLDPVKGNPFDDDLFLKWDGWKRDQVTGLLKKVSALVREKAAPWDLSCAVVPVQERAYSLAFQDWTYWLQEGIVDKVVLMNYTRDEWLSAQILRGALAFRGKGKIYSGLGLFLVKDAPAFKRIYDANAGLAPDGLVFFSYDDLKTGPAVR